jgi:hypothetical protein
MIAVTPFGRVLLLVALLLRPTIVARNSTLAQDNLGAVTALEILAT